MTNTLTTLVLPDVPQPLALQVAPPLRLRGHSALAGRIEASAWGAGLILEAVITLTSPLMGCH